MFDISTFKSGWRHRVEAVRARHRAALRISRELSDSSDRALAEIGIARGDIDTVARGLFARA